MIRMFRTVLPLFALLALVAAPAQAQRPYDKIETPPLPDFNVPEAERVELPNGMVVFLIEDHELPLVNVSARVGVGSVYEPADKVGLAAITGAVMRTGGSEAMTGDAMNAMLEGMGAIVEMNIGETSGFGFVSALRENFDDVLPVFVEMLVNPAFPQDKIDLEKTQHKSAISRRNDDPQDIAFREFGKLVYGDDSPYARHTEYATIDAITRDDLVAFHARFFHPNNVILGVWGDFEAGEMVRKLEAAFRGWPRNEGFTRPEVPPVAQTSERGVFFAPKTDVTQSTVLIGHPGEIRLDHPDYFAVSVMNEILSGGFSSRLFQKVRKEQGLAYAVFGGYSANYDRPGEFFAGTMTKSESTVEAARSMLGEVERMRAAPPTEAELTLAKDSYLNSFVFNFDTRQEIVNRVMTYEYYGYPLDFLSRTREGILAVDGDDVQRVAQQYLRPGEARILVVGNDAAFGEALDALGPVDTLDITIPTGEAPPPAATGESLAEGRRLLRQAADALGGTAAFAAVETARMTASTSVTTPDDVQMQVEMEVVRAYPDRFRIVQSLPMGQIEIVSDGATMVLKTPQGTMDAPPALAREMAAERWRDLIYLFAHAGDAGLQVQHAGREDVDGRATEVLLVDPPGEPAAFRLYLDAATKEPVAVGYGSMMTGAPVQVRDLLRDFREVGGVRLPHRVVSYHDGKPATEMAADEIVLNAEIDPATFATGQ